MIDRVTAFHESGHAVSATVFGFDVRRVQVHRPGTCVDEAGRCELSSWRSDINVDPTRALCYLLCGSAAEQQLTGHASPRDAHDREIAAGLAATVCEVDDVDHPRVRALVARAETLARALMCDPIVWRTVERVAAALQKKGAVSGRDVQLILRETKR